MWTVAADKLSILCREIKFRFQSPDLAAQTNCLIMLIYTIYCIHNFAVLDSDERWIFNILMHMSRFLMTSAFAILRYIGLTKESPLFLSCLFSSQYIIWCYSVFFTIIEKHLLKLYSQSTFKKNMCT